MFVITSSNKTQDQMETAQTIANQIGDKALFMIGAKSLGATENSLQFKVGRNDKKVTHVKIEHNSLDLYTMTFYNQRGYNASVVLSEVENVYADMLNTIITKHTGLDTSL
jgi:hypothetical protein